MDTQQLHVIKMAIESYMADLRHLEFSYLNPLFWVFFLLLFLILIFFRSWKPKKSLSYCLLTAAVLLINTKIEHMIARASAPGDGFDASILLRIISGMGIVFISIYYFLIRDD